MATVPGQPIDEGGIPKELQPRQADLLMAAAIMHQQGRMQLAGDVIDLMPKMQQQSINRSGGDPDAVWGELDKRKTRATLMRALGGGAKVLPIKPEGD